jgi:hypothetical protein
VRNGLGGLGDGISDALGVGCQDGWMLELGVGERVVAV